MTEIQSPSLLGFSGLRHVRRLETPAGYSSPMRAVRIHGRRDMRIEDVPDPDVGPGQVRIRVAEVGICGSDLHYLSDGAAGVFKIKAPLIPGHEMSGVVDADPSGRYPPGT